MEWRKEKTFAKVILNKNSAIADTAAHFSNFLCRVHALPLYLPLLSNISDSVTVISCVAIVVLEDTFT